MKPRIKLKFRAGGGPPVIPPTVTNNSSYAQAEEVQLSLPLTADQGGITWTIVGGADQALFSIDGSNLVLPAQNYEAPADAGANNSYVVTVRATNNNGSGDKTITINVTDVAEGAGGTPIRANQDIYAYDDVLAAITAAADDAWITASVTGPVRLCVWLKAQNSSGFKVLSNGQSFAFRKRELLNMPVARSVSASDGAAATWDFTWSGGSGSVSFNVQDFPLALTYRIGQRTKPGYGGPSIEDELPGNASDWSIFSQSTAGALAIWPNNYRLTWSSTGATPTSNYGGTRAVGTPTLGAGAYTVTLRHGPGTYADRVYSFDVETDIINIAPNPGVDTPGASFNGSNQYTGSVYTLCHGDTILAESGTYNTGSEIRVLFFNTNTFRTVNAATGVTKLTDAAGPFGGGDWTYTGLNHNAGWVTVKSRFPLGANLGPHDHDIRGIKVDGVNTVGYIGLHFFGLTGARNLRYSNRLGTAKEWFMVTHCDGAGLNPAVTARDYDRYIVLSRNFVHDSGDGIYLVARDSQVCGNLCERIQNDPFNTFLFDQTYTSDWTARRSRWMWNTNVRKDYVHAYPRTSGNQPHPDGNQMPEISSTMCPNLWAKPTSEVIAFQIMAGNAIMRTDGTLQRDASGVLTGFDEPDMQGFNGGTFAYSGHQYEIRMLGDSYWCMFKMGIAPRMAVDGSFVRNCLLVTAPYISLSTNPTTDPGYQGYVTPFIYAQGTAASGPLTIDHCALQNSAAYTVPEPTETPQTPVLIANVTSLNQATELEAATDEGDLWVDVETWFGGPVNKAKPAPKATSKLRVGQAGAPADIARTIGPYGDLTVIDHRREVFGTGLMDLAV